MTIQQAQLVWDLVSAFVQTMQNKPTEKEDFARYFSNRQVGGWDFYEWRVSCATIPGFKIARMGESAPYVKYYFEFGNPETRALVNQINSALKAAFKEESRS